MTIFKRIILILLVFPMTNCITQRGDMPIKPQKGNSEMPLYLQYNRPTSQRVDDLVSRMTLEEKISQMQFDAPAIEHLGIPEYNWWNECLHGVARAGVATVFPQAIALAATWNTELMYDVATAISDEARAKHHEFQKNNSKKIYQGLTFWSPNINIFRDPRWGRGQETYGEDPFLTSRMGVEFIKGLQGDDPKYLKVVATPKHYAVHSGPEPDRHHFNAKTDKRNLYDTYLPAFEACIKEAKAYSIMGAYNRYNNESCCASDTLLQQILRNTWGFDGYVVSDCGAINDIWKNHKIVATAPEAAALAVKRGCDLNCGNQYPNLLDAVELKLISEKEIDISIKRLMTARMKLGMFDPVEKVAYSQIPFEVNNCEKHRILSKKAALESIVLLKNENQTLPLKKNLKSIAVIGPNADDVNVLLGNYNGTPTNPVTILQGIKHKVSENTEVKYAKGCIIAENNITELKPIPLEFLNSNGKSGLKGEYFSNMKFSGNPVLTRYENVDFNWITNAPDTIVGNDQFSICWTGYLIPRVSGEYNLGVKADDGFRLFLDDNKIVELWQDQAAISKSKKVQLEANQKYKIKLEYYENGGGASVKLGWVPPDTENNMNKDSARLMKEALKIAENSDAVIIVGGISSRLEGEEMDVNIEGFDGGDRTNIKLPAIQRKLLKKLHKTGKPTIFILLNGSALAVNWADKNLSSILEAWYPGQEGGNAVADVIFGDYNPAGRLPVTFYKSVKQLPPFDDYDMKNRTYRYFKGKPLYPFGYGLSYTNFEYSDIKLSSKQITKDKNVSLSVNLKNTGEVDGDEVVQLYVSDLESSIHTPIKSLRAFDRIHLKAGKQKTISFELKPDDFSIIDNNGNRIIEPGEFQIQIGGNSMEGLITKLNIKEELIK